MTRCHRLDHRFVKHIPERLEPGVLYIALEFNTITHLCCCGCGEEVVTPLSPVGWRMTYDGEAISLWPSIGNWNLPCRSHYVIEQGSILEAGNWTAAQIEAERRRDSAAKERHYGPKIVAGSNIKPDPIPPAALNPIKEQESSGWLRRFWRRLVGSNGLP